MIIFKALEVLNVGITGLDICLKALNLKKKQLIWGIFDDESIQDFLNKYFAYIFFLKSNQMSQI